MAESNFRGPLTSMGSMEVQAGTAATVEVMDGDSVLYHGASFPDIQTAPFAKDGTAPGRQRAFMAMQTVWACDNVPQATATNVLAASQVATNALAIGLVTAGVSGIAGACSLAVGVPIIPVGTTVATVAAFAIDFGFTTGTTAANSSTVVVINNQMFHVGQWIVIGNVGNSSASRSLITQIQSISASNLTGITISPVAATTLSNCPIGQANLHGSGLLPLASQFGPSAPAATAHEFGGAMTDGIAKVMNPRETLTRNIYMTLQTTGTYSALVYGWDVWGNPMTELIAAASQTTVAGKKAFKYLGSIVSGTGSTDQVSFGLGDTFGFPFRSDEWEQTEISWAGSSVTNLNGWTAAGLTSPATNITGDVRGTIQLSTAILTGVLATSVSTVKTNNTSRLAIIQNLGVWNQVFATPINTVPMFGVAQSTT